MTHQAVLDHNGASQLRRQLRSADVTAKIILRLSRAMRENLKDGISRAQSARPLRGSSMRGRRMAQLGPKERAIMDFLHERIFEPILASPQASDNLKQGVRYTIMRMEQ